MSLVANDITKRFRRGGGDDSVKVAADRVSLKIDAGDFVAVVGESGSGKSTVARIMLDLLRPDSGAVSWQGDDVSTMTRAEKKRFRSQVQAVFQDPSSSMNPRKRIRTILGEVIRFYEVATGPTVREHAHHMLELVGLTPAEAFMDRFPHELSGGQRQRVSIARAMIPTPKVIIADEAVSALDVSVKAGVLRLMEDLRLTKGVGYLLISHDLPVVRKIARYVYVMRDGKIVEEGPTEQIFQAPRADYTRELLSAALDLETVLRKRRIESQLASEAPAA